MKVGDRVAKDSKAEEFFIVKEVHGTHFVALPNTPFERKWSGQVSMYELLPNTSHYWVLKTDKKPQSQTVPKTTKDSEYEVVLNFNGEVHTLKTRAVSEAQALSKACVKLATSTMKHLTHWTIYNHVKAGSRYKIKLLSPSN